MLIFIALSNMLMHKAVSSKLLLTSEYDTSQHLPVVKSDILTADVISV